MNFDSKELHKVILKVWRLWSFQSVDDRKFNRCPGNSCLPKYFQCVRTYDGSHSKSHFGRTDNPNRTFVCPSMSVGSSTCELNPKRITFSITMYPILSNFVIDESFHHDKYRAIIGYDNDALLRHTQTSDAVCPSLSHDNYRDKRI